MDRRVAWALDIGPDSSGQTVRLWSGPGSVTLDGIDYREFPAIRVSNIVLDGSPPEVGLVLPVTESSRAGWLAWEGVVPGVFRYLWLDDSTWRVLGPRISGEIRDPRLVRGDGGETVELTIRTLSPERPPVSVWSAEAQADRFTGDIGFALLRESATIRGTWPR